MSLFTTIIHNHQLTSQSPQTRKEKKTSSTQPAVPKYNLYEITLPAAIDYYRTEVRFFFVNIERGRDWD